MKKRILSNVSIGKFIRDKRTELNYSQDDLARELGITKTAISNWENGNSIVDVKYLVPLSNIFSVKIDDILFPNSLDYGTKNYCDVSNQFQEIVTFKLIDPGQTKKTLDLFVECKNQCVSLIKQYKENEKESILNEILFANIFGLTLDGFSILDSKQIKRCVSNKIEDQIRTLWYPIVLGNKNFDVEYAPQKAFPHIFLKKQDLDYVGDLYDGFQLDSNAAMMEFVYTFGGERIFKKFVQSFSKDYQNELLCNLIFLSETTKKFDRKLHRAIKWLLRAGCEYWVDGENRTIEVYQKCI